MKKILFTLFLFLLEACSQYAEPNSASSISTDMGSVNAGFEKAEAMLRSCNRQDLKILNLEDSTFDGGRGISVPLEDSMLQGDFSVELDVSPESLNADGGIASSGVLGEGAGWILRQEDGKVVLYVRGQGADSWIKIYAGKSLDKGWNEIRLDHVDSLLALTLNGEMVFAVESDVDFSKMKGEMTIGFSTESAKDTSYFRGRFGRFCYRHLGHHHDKHWWCPKDTSAIDSSVADSSFVDSAVVDTFTLDTSWVLDLEFDDPGFVGRDFSGNGYHASVYEGTVTADSGIAFFDGRSGLRLDEGRNVRLGDFVINARVFPRKVSGFNNILVTEPPGFGPDGWIFRFEEGSLVFLVRDADWDSDWEGVSIDSVETDKWYDIRVECTSDSVRMYVNGTLGAQKALAGNYDNLEYQWGIGYDAVNQSIHNRYFNGYIDYIRVGRINRSGE